MLTKPPFPSLSTLLPLAVMTFGFTEYCAITTGHVPATQAAKQAGISASRGGHREPGTVKSP